MTETVTGPGGPGGVVIWISLASSRVAVAAVGPSDTLGSPEKPAPTTVAIVPPAVGPREGTTPKTASWVASGGK